MNGAKLVVAIALCGVAAALLPSSCVAQEVTGELGSPGATTTRRRKKRSNVSLTNRIRTTGGASMVNRNSSSKAQRIARRTILTFAALGFLALGGCSSSEPTAAQQASMAKTELHFDLNACQQIEPGLYKCPAADKPICNPDYNGQAECVRIGPKGSVYVQSGI